MTEREWTKGPWTVNKLAGPTEISTVDPFEDVGVAYTDGPQDARSIANAHLIAAAPELFEALDKAYAHICANIDLYHGQLLDQIEAALRKAQGVQP